jgi:two-component system chemotaxis response regulator CheY
MKKILVVEDDPSMRWLLRNLLHGKYEVITKNNGIEAFSWLSVQNIPDLIISDIKMPLMDGFEFIENLSISGLYKNIPVIVLTGHGDSATFKRCTNLGVYSFLTKPFKPTQLLEKIAFPFVSQMFLEN